MIFGNFPEDWSTSDDYIYLQTRKPPSMPFSYRPISLTSDLYKITKKIVVRRLSWYLVNYTMI